ncbi:hypothetical protein KQX54_000415, partial [Cotesia glomerata]
SFELSNSSDACEPEHWLVNSVYYYMLIRCPSDYRSPIILRKMEQGNIDSALKRSAIRCISHQRPSHSVRWHLCHQNMHLPSGRKEVAEVLVNDHKTVMSGTEIPLKIRALTTSKNEKTYLERSTDYSTCIPG